MRATCPSCSAVYGLPPDIAEAIGVAGEAGRQLRCTRCGHVWLQRPAEDSAAGDAAASARFSLASIAPDVVAATPLTPAPEDREAESAVATADPVAVPTIGAPTQHVTRLTPAFPPAAESPSRPHAGRAVWIGWAASLVLVASGLVTLWSGRASVMRAVPASVPAYVALGASPPH